MVLEHLFAFRTLFFLLSGLFFLFLAVWLLLLDPRDRVARTFALFLMIRGGFDVASGLLNTVDPRLQSIGLSLHNPFLLATFFVTLLFLLASRNKTRPDPRLRLAGIGVATAGLIVIGAYLLDPNLYARYETSRDGRFVATAVGPFSLFAPGNYLAYALVAWIMARDIPFARSDPGRQALLLTATGFSLMTLFVSVRIFLVTLEPGSINQSFQLQLLLISGTSLIVVVAAAVRIWQRARAGATHDERRLATILLVLMGLSLSSTLLVAIVRVLAPGSDLILFQSLAGLWSLALPLFVTYALVRHKLFGLDARIKWTLEKGTIASAFIIVFFLAGQGFEIITTRIVGRALGEWAGITAGIAASAGLAFAFKPLQRVAQKAFDYAMPGTKPLTKMDLEEREAAYVDFVQAAWEGRELTPTQQRVLVVAQQRLGISAPAAARLERKARTAAIGH